MVPLLVRPKDFEFDSQTSTEFRHREARPMAMIPYAADRVARLMVRGIGSELDLKRFRDWAEVNHMTEDCLRRYCRLSGLKGHAAHGLVRAGRALRVHRDTGDSFEQILDIADDATMRRFKQVAAFDDNADLRHMTDLEFLERQRFVTERLLLARLAQLLRGGKVLNER